MVAESQPSWAAWIEITVLLPACSSAMGRSPLGLRGLKYHIACIGILDIVSQPSWAAWIEISTSGTPSPSLSSQPSWAAWIEIIACALAGNVSVSQPSWAAWIEIVTAPCNRWSSYVAALLGCVD